MATKKSDPQFIYEDPSNELSDQQKLFCHEYITQKFNGTQAAINAGYSPRSAKEQAARLLTNHNIRTLLTELKKDLGLRLGITRERIALELAKTAFLDIGDLLEDTGTIRAIGSMGEAARGSIAAVEITELYNNEGDNIGQTKKIKVWNKIDALKSLANLLGYDAPTKIAQTDPQGNQLPTTDLSKLTDDELRSLAELQRKSRAGEA